MTERFGPDPEDVPLVALFGHTDVPDIADLIARTRRITADLQTPVQALAAERVLSWTHLVMAHTHAARARDARRARSEDPTIEFVLYAAADRQIHRALDAVGVPPGTRVPVCLVALGAIDPDRFRAAGAAARIDTTVTWRPATMRPAPPRAEAARRFWAKRLALDESAPTPQVEDALLGAMALLAVQKA